jgi:hypothetical protein
VYRRLRRANIPIAPIPSSDKLPGSGVDNVFVLNARLVGSVEALELLTKSFAVSLA